MLPPSLMNGTSSGHLPLARVICMRVSMSTRRSIISPRVMRLLEKIDFASIALGCKKDMESNTLILSQTPTSCPMSLENSMSTTKS